MSAASHAEKTRLQLLYQGEECRDLLTRIAAAKGLKFTETFCWMIEDIKARPSLGRRISEFTRRTEGCWRTEGERGSFFVRVPVEIANAAHYYSFSLLGSGNLSAFLRVLVHYYAVQLDIIAEPTKTLGTKRPAFRADSSSNKTAKKTIGAQKKSRTPQVRVMNEVQRCFTISAKTEQQIKAIVPVFQQKRMAMLRTMIEETASSEESIKELQHFCYKKFEDQPKSEGRMFATRFNLTVELEGLLKSLSMTVLGTEEKSLMVRILVAYYTDKMGIAA